MKPIIIIALLFMTTPVYGAFIIKDGYIVAEQEEEETEERNIIRREPVTTDTPAIESTTESTNEDERVKELKRLIDRLEKIIDLLEIRLKYE